MDDKTLQEIQFLHKGGNARKLCLSKRIKNYWHKSNSPLSLKNWARSSEDLDVRAWLKVKNTPPVKSAKTKVVKTPKTDKPEKKKNK